MRRILPSVALALLAFPAVLATDGPVGTTTLFADVPSPGFPEGIVVDEARGVVYVGGPAELSLGKLSGVATVHAFDLASGALLRTYPLGIGDPSGVQALSNLALDAKGRVIALHNQPGIGVVILDPGTGAVTLYAPIPDLAPCLVRAAPCSPTLADRMALPNDLVFTPDGTLYVTDSWQATIWRVPPGGGAASIWYQDARFDEPFGFNGLVLNAAQDGFFVAKTFSYFHPELPSGIYTLPLVAAPTPADLGPFAALGGGPDGIALGTSGRLWVVAATDNQVVALDSRGGEVARFPDPVANALAAHPYDAPATPAFVNGRQGLLVTNHALFTGYALPQHFDVLEAFVADTGVPAVRPDLP